MYFVEYINEKFGVGPERQNLEASALFCSMCIGSVNLHTVYLLCYCE